MPRVREPEVHRTPMADSPSAQSSVRREAFCYSRGKLSAGSAHISACGTHHPDPIQFNPITIGPLIHLSSPSPCHSISHLYDDIFSFPSGLLIPVFPTPWEAYLLVSRSSSILHLFLLALSFVERQGHQRRKEGRMNEKWRTKHEPFSIIITITKIPPVTANARKAFHAYCCDRKSLFSSLHT